MAKVVSALEELGQELLRRPGDHWVGGPTLSVGKIGGGVAVNIVPEECWIDIDRRLIPGETAAGAYREINDFVRARVGDSVRFTSRKPWSELEPLEDALGQRTAKQFGRSIRAIRGEFETSGVPFGTDAAVYARVGVPCVVFGPGSIDQAHTADEHIALDQVDQAAEIYFHYCQAAGKGDD
jgi:acetylornithine deacetylase